MKKSLKSTVCLVIVAALLSSCGSTDTTTSTSTSTSTSTTPTSTSTAATTTVGQGDGFGGLITATVTMDGGKITAVEVDAPSETAGISDPAIAGIPEAMVAAGNADVDVVAGATWTSKGIIYAVKNAIEPTAYPYPPVADAKDVEALNAAGATLGLGVSSMGRIGPGTDDDGNGVYSWNQIYAAVIFDNDGKAVAINIDQLEVATPNYGSELTPAFAGYPGQDYYGENYFADDDAYLALFDGWVTKKERGSTYLLNSGSWKDQIEKFEEIFVGMTVTEIGEWFDKYCSDVNGRPLQEPTDTSSDEDTTKYNALSDDEKTMLADVVSSATMSLNDGHGDIIVAIQNAYTNRVAIDSSTITGFGLAFDGMGRVTSSSYSFNNVVAAVVTDADGKIIATNIDQVEVSRPSEGGTSPSLVAYPGQLVGDLDLVPTDDDYLAAIDAWLTKKERGDNYVMGIGSWASQISGYEKLFIGMSVDEVNSFFTDLCSDENGRPLQEPTEDTSESNTTKYEALTDDQKAVLADVISSATMSLYDGHGDIYGTVIKAINTTVPVNITVG